MDNGIVFADDVPDSTLHDRFTRGEIVRLARGIYSTDVDADPSDVVRRAWREIVGRRFPHAVVTDRSAVWAQPHDGYLFIASARDGSLELPGLVVVSRKGPGAVEGDIAMGAGVHLASRPRAFLDNTRPTRRRSVLPPATLARAELADWIDHLCAVDGAERVSEYRDAAEALADTLEVSPARVERLNEIVGAALGTRDSTSGSQAMKARAAGIPFDQGRVLRFELLANHLRDVVTSHPALLRRRVTACDPAVLGGVLLELHRGNRVHPRRGRAHRVRGRGSRCPSRGCARCARHLPARLERGRYAAPDRFGR